ncbi:alpha-L-rhamnosidase-related protein [Flavitalea sp.]|nr:alpha-L-rhamnosidase C-terminal domain-containing protein [Flavitalea sp.]
MKRLTILCFLATYIQFVFAQELPINPILLKQQWKSSWITCPDAPQRDYGIYHFRKSFSLNTKPGQFIIHVTADNRYRLFVNGKSVCSGPARGDLYNWYFETIDIAPFLQAGENLLAAVVWNMGTDAPVAQISNQTGLVVQGNGPAEELVNTNNKWKVMQNPSYSPCSQDNGSRLRTYMVIGPGDEVDGSKYPWGWEQLQYDDSKWKTARQITSPVTAGYGTDNIWTLKPRNIPLMEEKLQRIDLVRRTTGMENENQSKLISTYTNSIKSGKEPITIPANKKVSILLDQSFNTVAYPELILTGGKGSSVTLTYAEALFKGRVKGHRDSIEGKELIGNFDIFKTDGGNKRLFRPLWLRTYRYIQVDIVTGNEPLVIDDLYGMYTGYPFKEVATFTSNDQSLKEIWDVGWRTARLCAGETYYDCPYYEQLQYEGDTRIQSLISLYVTGDDRLMRKALLDFFHSRVPEGLTQGRYPSNRLQVIPPFSLYWVTMIHDYWMHRKDAKFLEQFLVGVQGVLDWYEKNIDSSKSMLGPMKWWGFTDWNRAFPNGVPDGATDGNSAVISLQFVYTLKQAAEFFDYYGKKNEASHYRSLADKISKAVYQQCFDAGKGVMANTPMKNTFSQHASIMGVITGSVPVDKMKAVMNKVLTDTSLSQATFYYRFYLTIALKKAGLSQLYYEQLKPWRDMLSVGLTTFAENPDPTRSDCHAWSASPNYDFFATICGIVPDAPGFKKILISPSPGKLNNVVATMPHPDGLISVDLTRQNKDGLKGSVTLPSGTTGRFVWNGKEINLKAGKQQVNFN